MCVLPAIVSGATGDWQDLEKTAASVWRGGCVCYQPPDRLWCYMATGGTWKRQLHRSEGVTVLTSTNAKKGRRQCVQRAVCCCAQLPLCAGRAVGVWGSGGVTPPRVSLNSFGSICKSRVYAHRSLHFGTCATGSELTGLEF